MLSQAQASKIEQKTLTLSVILVFCAAIWSTTMAILTRSMSAGMDAAFSLLSAILTGLGVILVRFIQKGYTRRHPMGFYPYEAMIVLVRSLFLGGMLVVLFVDAVQVIMAGGQEINVPLMLMYIFPSLCLGISGFTVCYQGYKKTPTMTLEADLNEWRSGLFIVMMVFISIIINIILKKTPFAHFSRYTDSINVIVLTLILIKEPVFLIIDAFRHLMMQSIDSKFSRPFRHNLKEYATEKFPDFEIKMIDVIQVGRITWVFVEIVSLNTSVPVKVFLDLDTEIDKMARQYFKHADCLLYFSDPTDDDLMRGA
ncbi:MAG: cation transporter [Brevinema sp.]